MSEVNKSDWDTASNPVLAYADRYRQMARTGTAEIHVWSVITDIERNIAPLMADALSQLAALREELAQKVVLAVRDVCELDPADSNDPECICIKASDLGAILSRHFEGVE